MISTAGIKEVLELTDMDSEDEITIRVLRKAVNKEPMSESEKFLLVEFIVPEIGAAWDRKKEEIKAIYDSLPDSVKGAGAFDDQRPAENAH